MHQIIIYSLILYLCSPCLINGINCGKTIKFATDRGFRPNDLFGYQKFNSISVNDYF
jgi:hypothetical protein